MTTCARRAAPYVVMALAAAGSTRLRLTEVAKAFPRSPTVTAVSAWNIQKLSRGRFVLGSHAPEDWLVHRKFSPESLLEKVARARSRVRCCTESATWSDRQKPRRPGTCGRSFAWL